MLPSAFGANYCSRPKQKSEITDVGAVNLHDLEVLIEVREPARHGFGSDELPLQVCKPVLPHDLGVHEPKHARYVVAIERLEALHESVHVLLRHRLLRKPGGFEGFAAEAERVKRTLGGQVILDPDE